MSLRQFIKRSVRRIGLDVNRFHPATSGDACLIAMLRHHDINLILDVGANTGQFAKLLRELGYRRRIVSFEPLTAAHRKLVAAAQRDPLWEVAERVAIGNEAGEIEINIAGNSVSSSGLDMLDSHASAAPESQYVGRETVQVRTLDDMAAPHVTAASKLFVKIDTQGFEGRVLQGARKVLQAAVGLQLELSLVPLYKGQRSGEELYSDLKEAGFRLWSVTPAFVEAVSGRLLQVDATFFRDGP
jgi:FkbM family methyltransferase